MKDTSTNLTVQFLTEIYTTYRPLVFRYISYKLNGCLEAEDLVQDAFLRLLEYRSMLRPETVRSFLYTIVRNLVTDYLRRHYKKTRSDGLHDGRVAGGCDRYRKCSCS